VTSTDFVVSSRPAVKIDGIEDAGATQGLVYLRVDDSTEGLAHCELQVGNWGLKDGANGFLYFDRQTLDFGKELVIEVGGRKVFQGRISALEAGFPHSAPPVLTVLAEDRLQDLRMRRRTTAYADMSDSDIITQIASDHGLTPAVDVTGTTHKNLSRVGETDLAFLRRRAAELGAEIWVDDRTLHVAPRGSRTTSPRPTLSYGRELREVTVTADLAHQRSRVGVRGWDPTTKEEVFETIGDGALGAELSGGDSGASILASAGFKARLDDVWTNLAPTPDQARDMASARMRRIARRFVVARGVADAVAGLVVGARVDFDGTGPLFDGEYYVTETTYVFDAGLGLRVEFTGERPWLGRPR
jgi:uncharacterized protein